MLQQHLIEFILYVIIQAWCINGIKASASGTTIKNPDGSDRDGEMILYPFFKYLTQRTIVKLFYKSRGFHEVIKTIDSLFGDLGLDYNITDGSVVFDRTSKAAKLKWKKVEEELRQQFDQDLRIEYDDWRGKLYFYKEAQKYKFSKWIRKPIIECVVCMSSFWGIFLFWIPVVCMYGFNPLIIPIGIVNTFCVAYLNKLIYR